ncbi:MAG: hypothetical protein OXR73_11690 [Myxococcales bacterium]|nr:hypothetical protein [Myxococcales bacterium]
MKHPDHPWVLHHAAPVYILAFPETFDDDEIAQMYDALAHWWPQVRQPVITVVDYSVCRRADAL